MHPRRCRRREFALPCRRVALRRAWGPPRLDRPRAKAGRLHSPFSSGAQGSCGSRRRASQREAGPRASCRVAMTFIKSDSGIQTPWCNCGRARPGETACRRSAAGRGYPKPRFTPVPCGVSPEPSRGAQPDCVAGSQPEKVLCTLGSAVLWSQSRAKGRRKIACGQRCLEKHQASWSRGRRPVSPSRAGAVSARRFTSRGRAPGGRPASGLRTGRARTACHTRGQGSQEGPPGCSDRVVSVGLGHRQEYDHSGSKHIKYVWLFFFLCESHIGTSKWLAHEQEFHFMEWNYSS